MNPDYSAYAGGQVFYSRSGFTAFPVRIASAIFSKCISLLEERATEGPYVLYDPCCGSGQLLVMLVLLYGHALSHVIGSDIRPEAVALAEKNLSLLTPAGMEKRIEELQELIVKFGKDSHKVTVQHALAFKEKLMELYASQPLETKVFLADALEISTIDPKLEGIKANLVITDIPYGQGTSWTTGMSLEERSPAEQMLETLLPVLERNSIVAIASNRQQKVMHPAYLKRDQFKVGKRRVVFLTPKDEG